MSWRESIKPLKQAVIRPHWKNTIRPEPKNGKDFNFFEHESKIYSLIKKAVNSIKSELKLKFSDLTPQEKLMIKGEKGDSIKGDKGKDANRWHVFEKIDNSVGKNGDYALNAKTYEILEKYNGEWISITKFKLPEQRILTSGGVSEQFVIDYVAANGGGSTDWIIQSTTASVTLTTQDVIIAKGTNPLTITLKDAASADKPVVVKNKTNQTLTINVDGGALIDDDTSWEISPNTAFEFVPQGGQYYAY